MWVCMLIIHLFVISVYADFLEKAMGILLIIFEKFIINILSVLSVRGDSLIGYQV